MPTSTGSTAMMSRAATYSIRVIARTLTARFIALSRQREGGVVMAALGLPWRAAAPRRRSAAPGRGQRLGCGRQHGALRGREQLGLLRVGVLVVAEGAGERRHR